MSSLLVDLTINVAGSAIWDISKKTFQTVGSWTTSFEKDLNGNWLAYYAANGSLKNEIVEVVQIGKTVCGIIKGLSNDRQYKFTGTFNDGVLVATFQCQKPKRIFDRGSFTLQINPYGNTRVLWGCYAWTDDYVESPASDDYLWIKNPLTALPDRVKVKSSSIQGEGVFANEDFNTNDILAYFSGDVIYQSSKYSLTLDGRHVEPIHPLKHLNHSCSPNSYFDGRWLLAKGPVSKDCEVTIDYLETEYQIVNPIVCKCGHRNCRKTISTSEIQDHPSSLLQKIEGSWSWFDGNFVHFFSSGRVVSSAGVEASIEIRNVQSGNFLVKWSPGWVDDLTLSMDGKSVAGLNGNGQKISGQKKL